MWTAISRKARRSLEEEPFAFVAAGLRKLKPLRKHLPVLLGDGAEPTGRCPRRGGPVAPPFASGDGRAAVQEPPQSCRLSHYSFIGRSTPAC